MNELYCFDLEMLWITLNKENCMGKNKLNNTFKLPKLFHFRNTEIITCNKLQCVGFSGCMIIPF